MFTFAKDPYFAFEDATAALKTLASLTVDAFASGEENQRNARGLAVLFDQQTAILDEACDYIHQNEQAKKAGATGLRKVEPAGINMVMVTEPDGKRYMTTPALAGVDPAGVTKMRVEESPKQVRERVISELLSDGKTTGEIAQAINLKKTQVEQVLAQLLGGKLEIDSDVPPVAVNQ